MSIGAWVELERSWTDTTVRNCPVCGKLITRRAWRFAAVEGALDVCEPSCQELYESYWWPNYGRHASSRPVGSTTLTKRGI
jgi:hypothetical protein